MTDTGLIFDIQGFSVHDGPGTRTLVFFGGCPLHCEWCANPEGREIAPCLLFASGRCKSVQNHCSRCESECPQKAIRVSPLTNLPVINRQACWSCTGFNCADACSFEALRVSGQYYTADKLLHILNRDRHFWGSDGGVTFGGGEPLMQSQFLLKILQHCRENMIHTAIETCAFAEERIFLQVMESIDFAFIDIKHMDTDAHFSKTGVGNEQILNNLRALAKSNRNQRIILRMPMIPDFNDAVDNALATIEFMKENGFFEINLLPFHRLGSSKWEQLGLSYPYCEQPNMEKERLYPLAELYLDAGIACYVDTDVIYSVTSA